MENSLELLQQINWFLKPVSDFLLFFVTTLLGRILLLSGFFIYFIATYAHSLKLRKLAGKGSTAYGSGFIPLGERIYLLIRDLFRPVLKIIIQFPVVLGIIVALSMLVGISTALQSTQAFLQNQKKIEELSTVVKQLDKRYKVASLTIKDVDYVKGITKLDIQYYSNDKTSGKRKTQSIEIKGYDIYFDALVLNFNYSTISQGEKHNLVLPYRIFSEKMAAVDGIKLNYMDADSIPLLYERGENEIYGVDAKKYPERVKELMRFTTDKQYARKMGVRSFLGNSVHKVMYKGKKYDIWIEQTGGLVLKTKTSLF